MPTKSLKAADKQTILKKLVTEMKKRYGSSLPKHSYNTFESLLFAACLEDSNYQEAEAAYVNLLEKFYDLNEIRVSSVAEVEAALGNLRNTNWKAMRIRETLQHVFETHYAFDLEHLKRKTQEQAVKELTAVPHQSSFMSNFVLQQALGAHVIPVDPSIRKLLVWLGLVGYDQNDEECGEEVKSGIKKTEAPQLCYLLKMTSVDPELIEHFEDGPEAGIDPMDAGTRLAELFKNPKKKKKKPEPKPVEKAKAEPKTAEKKPAKVEAKVDVKAPGPLKASLAKSQAKAAAKTEAAKASTKAAPAKTKTAKAVSVKKPVKKVETKSRAKVEKKAATPVRKVTKKVPAKPAKGRKK